MKLADITTPAGLLAYCPTTVAELLAMPGWESYQESKLGNDLFINNPERAARIHDAAEDGCDGSTNAEHIEDWQEFARDTYAEIMGHAFSFDLTDEEAAALDRAIDDKEAALYADIDRCEKWHADNGSLEEQGA